MNWIELTHKNNDNKVLINLDLITDISDMGERGTYIYFTAENRDIVEESYAEVKERIAEKVNENNRREWR